MLLIPKEERRREDVVREASSAELARVHDQNPFGAPRLRARAARRALPLQERNPRRYGVVDPIPRDAPVPVAQRALVQRNEAYERSGRRHVVCAREGVENSVSIVAVRVPFKKIGNALSEREGVAGQMDVDIRDGARGPRGPTRGSLQGSGTLHPM